MREPIDKNGNLKETASRDLISEVEMSDPASTNRKLGAGDGCQGQQSSAFGNGKAKKCKTMKKILMGLFIVYVVVLIFTFNLFITTAIRGKFSITSIASRDTLRSIEEIIKNPKLVAGPVEVSILLLFLFSVFVFFNFVPKQKKQRKGVDAAMEYVKKNRLNDVQSLRNKFGLESENSWKEVS